jgi:hypothetical protein
MSIKKRILATLVIVAFSMLVAPSANAEYTNPASSSEIGVPVSIMEATATVFAESAGVASKIITGTLDFVFGIFRGPCD